MSRNTKKIEKVLATKGLRATVTWTSMAKEDGDGGIDGFHSDEVQGARYLDVAGREERHSGWLGYSVVEALRMLDGIDRFVKPAMVRLLEKKNQMLADAVKNNLILADEKT